MQYEADSLQREKTLADSSVAWTAVIGGAIAATSSAIALATLGAGFGLSFNHAPSQSLSSSVTMFTVGAAIWLVVVQWLSSALGGYLTGRMRTRWRGIHDHEVFFRDTVNGFLAWALAALLIAAVVGSATRSLTSDVAPTASTMMRADGRTVQGENLDPFAYLADSLYRSSKIDSAESMPDVRDETIGILHQSFRPDGISENDKAYLAELVAARTGVTLQAAYSRVTDVVAQSDVAAAQEKQAVVAARKAAARFALFTAIAMLIGAFIAAAAGALGGIHRDEWQARLLGEPIRPTPKV